MPLKISVVIPVFNAEKYLSRCIKSVVGQTEQNIEIILVNDGSTDDSGKVCKSFANADSRIKYIEQENSGSQASRKHGVNAATGDYITFIDADDWIESDYYEKVCNQLEKNTPDIFCVGFTQENLNVKKYICNNVGSGFYKDEALRKLLEKAICSNKNPYESGVIPSVWSKFIKKELAKQIFNQVDDFIKLGEDAVCTYGCISFAKTIEIQNDIAGYHYVFNETSIVHSYDKLYFKRLKVLKKNLIELINKGYYKQILIGQVKPYFTFLYHYGVNQLRKELKDRLKKFFIVRAMLKIKWFLVYTFFTDKKLKEMWKQEKKERDAIYSQYKGVAVTNKENNKTAIVMFDGKMAAGGLCDRLRGVISVYQTCKEKNISFKLNFVHPFNLQEFLVPNT